MESEPSKTTVKGEGPKTLVELATAVGAWFGLTTIVTVVVSDSPSSSVTVSVAV